MDTTISNPTENAVGSEFVLSRTFEAAHGGMQKGWAGTLDQLAGYLAKVQAEKAA